MKHGILLINVGTPDSPQPDDVGRYLSEFLLDPKVIDIPAPLRWFLVKALIVPKRKYDSAKLYQKVWTEKGSPLLAYTESLTQLLRNEISAQCEVEFAMRYGKPSISSALRKWQASSVEHITILPLYPQYSLAATESAEIAVRKWAKKILPSATLKFIPPFFKQEAYLGAAEKVSRRYLEGVSYDFALFSFHGLPERQIKKTDKSRSHCLTSQHCCDEMKNPDCYRAQSFWTANELAKRLAIPKDRYQVCFQSRLGRTPWIRPYTDEFYRILPKQGVKKLVVLCPSFVSDCLETLEEVQIRGKEEFLRHGGQSLTLIPSLNAEPEWVAGMKQLLHPFIAS